MNKHMQKMIVANMIYRGKDRDIPKCLNHPPRMTIHTYIKHLLGTDKSGEYIMNFRKIITLLTRSSELLPERFIIGIYGGSSCGKSIFSKIMRECFESEFHIPRALPYGLSDISTRYNFVCECDYFRFNDSISQCKKYLNKTLIILDFDLSKEENKRIPISIRFPNRFEYDPFFEKNLTDQISHDIFRRYFNVQVSPQEIPSLVKYFQDL